MRAWTGSEGDVGEGCDLGVVVVVLVVLALILIAGMVAPVH